ncbi:MAG: hypothetical protein AB8G16_07920 [Gammaproteobacteria bacterium]
MTKSRTLWRAVWTVALGALAFQSAAADDAVKHGQKIVSESTLMEKTANGREYRRIITRYNWDDGVTYSDVYDKAGTLLETRTSTLGLAPDEAELARAYELVWQDQEVQDIRRQQAGIDINGGFTHTEKSGKCAAPARCIQVFLFDGENVVKHMLVDLRTDRIVDHDYVPPRNRGQ